MSPTFWLDLSTGWFWFLLLWQDAGNLGSVSFPYPPPVLPWERRDGPGWTGCTSDNTGLYACAPAPHKLHISFAKTNKIRRSEESSLRHHSFQQQITQWDNYFTNYQNLDKQHLLLVATRLKDSYIAKYLRLCDANTHTKKKEETALNLSPKPVSSLDCISIC